MGAGRDRSEWWSRWECEDPRPTHVIRLRPELEVRLALAPGSDPEEVVAEAVAAWTDELGGDTPSGRPPPEFWGRVLGEDGLVVAVVALGEAAYDLAPARTGHKPGRPRRPAQRAAGLLSRLRAGLGRPRLGFGER